MSSVDKFVYVVVILFLFLLGFRLGLVSGKSQCYPYAVPYSEAKGQGDSK